MDNLNKNIGSIFIDLVKNKTRTHYISSKLSWFDCDAVIFKIYPSHISITKPIIDYNGKTYKPTKQRNLFRFSVVVVDILPVGTFYIDNEDSTEDELVIYHK